MGVFSIYTKYAKGVSCYPGPEAKNSTLTQICLSKVSINATPSLKLAIQEFKLPYLQD